MEIGIIGSCASRDAFNSKIVPNYKDFFSVSCYQFQMSIISLMSKPIPFEDNKFVGNATKVNMDHLRSELTKQILNELVLNKPKYILLDFYADVMFGAIKTGDSYITNKVFKFKDIRVADDLEFGEHLAPRKNFEEFFEIWKISLQKFMDFCKDYLPESKIIINQPRMTNEYFDDVSKEVKLIDDKKTQTLNQINSIWDKLDSYAVSEYNLRTLNYNNKKYYADKNHIWDLYHLHFTNNYYRDFKDKLLKLIFEDLQQNIVSSDEESHHNLILNSSFNQGNSYWSNWRDEFKVISSETEKNNRVRLEMKNEEKNRNFQIWSNPFEINADGQDSYTLSFEVKIDKNNKIDSEQMIFCIRTFNSNDKKDKKDSVEQYALTTNDFEIKYDETTRCTFTFKPTGRFIRVAPYLLRNGTIEWGKIQLEKTNKASEWKERITASV